jgi:hypothetical protein
VPAEVNVLVKENGALCTAESHNPLVSLVVEWLMPAQAHITRSLTAMLVVAGVKTSPPLPTSTLAVAANPLSEQLKTASTALRTAILNKFRITFIMLD